MQARTRILIGALCALAPLLGASAQTLEEGLALKKSEKLAEAVAVFAAVAAKDPQNVAALEQQATVLGWLSRYDEAIAAWTQALVLRPRELAYVLGRARVRYWRGDHTTALLEVEAALTARPDNFDALVLAGDICAAKGDNGAARTYYERALTQDPSVAEVQKKLARTPAGGPPRLRFDLGGNLDFYDTARGTEGLAFVQAGMQVAKPLNVSLGVEQMRWFGQIDTRVNAVVSLGLPIGLGASVRAAFTPDANFLAQWELWGTLDWQTLPTLQLSLWARHNEYAASSVTTLLPNFQLQIDRVTLTGQIGVTFSTGADPTFGVALKLWYAFTEDVSGYLGGARGNEPMPPLPSAATTSVFGGVVWNFSQTIGMRLDYAFDDREDAFKKHTIGTALTLRL